VYCVTAGVTLVPRCRKPTRMRASNSRMLKGLTS